MFRKPLRLMALAIALALGATACGSGGGGSEPQKAANGMTKIKLGVYETTYAGLLEAVMAKKGFLEKEGIQADIVGNTDGAKMMATLVSGQADFSTVSPGFWPAINQGECFKTYGFGSMEYFTLIATKKAQVPGIDKGFPDSVKGLKGLRVGVVARGTATERLASLVLQDAGLDPAKDVTFIATGATQTSVAAFENGQVDALLAYPPVEAILNKNGTPFRVVANLHDGSVDSIKDAFITMSGVNCDYAEKNPAVVTAVCKAHHAAYKWAADPANKEEMGKVSAEIFGVDAEMGKSLWEQYGASILRSGPTPEPTLWNKQAEYYPGVKTAPDFTKYAITNCG